MSTACTEGIGALYVTLKGKHMKIRLVVEAALSKGAILETLKNMAEKAELSVSLTLGDGEVQVGQVGQVCVDLSAVEARLEEVLSTIEDGQAQLLKVINTACARGGETAALPATKSKPAKAKVKAAKPAAHSPHVERVPTLRCTDKGVPLAVRHEGRVWLTYQGAGEVLGVNPETVRARTIESKLARRISSESARNAFTFIDPQTAFPWLAANTRHAGIQRALRQLKRPADIDAAVDLYIQYGPDTASVQPATTVVDEPAETAPAETVVAEAAPVETAPAGPKRDVLTHNSGPNEVAEVARQAGCAVATGLRYYNISHPSWGKTISHPVKARHCPPNLCNKINRLP